MKINDFDTQIQSDELASLMGKPGTDWINDKEESDRDCDLDLPVD